MSSIVHWGNHPKDIYTKEQLAKQLKEALKNLENNDTNLIVVEISTLRIEIDENDDEVVVIA